MFRHPIAIISILLVVGCTSTDRISLVQGESQEALTRDGRGTLVSTKSNMVMLQPASAEVRSRGRPAFVVAVLNRGKKPVELKVSGITAEHVGTSASNEPLHVFSYEELVAEERRRQTWAAVGVALQAAGASMSAANAGYSTTHGTYSGSSYGSYSGGLHGTYSGSSYGTYSATTYDAGRAYAAQQSANAQTVANVATLQATGQRNLAQLQNTILKDNTVMPGEWIGGFVILDAPAKNRDGLASYKVNVEFGGEVHSFQIAQAAAS